MSPDGAAGRPARRRRSTPDGRPRCGPSGARTRGRSRRYGCRSRRPAGIPGAAGGGMAPGAAGGRARPRPRIARIGPRRGMAPARIARLIPAPSLVVRRRAGPPAPGDAGRPGCTGAGRRASAAATRAAPTAARAHEAVYGMGTGGGGPPAASAGPRRWPRGASGFRARVGSWGHSGEGSPPGPRPRGSPPGWAPEQRCRPPRTAVRRDPERR